MWVSKCPLSKASNYKCHAGKYIKKLLGLQCDLLSENPWIFTNLLKIGLGKLTSVK